MVPKMIAIDSRILSPPMMQYGNSQSMQPRDGQWNMRGVRVVQACSVRSWGVLVSDRRDENGVISKYAFSMTPA